MMLLFDLLIFAPWTPVMQSTGERLTARYFSDAIRPARAAAAGAAD
jgi:hypothetical protein